MLQREKNICMIFRCRYHVVATGSSRGGPSQSVIGRT